MKLSVVVCAKNDESTIKECLESIRSNKPSEVIVVHGESTDNTLKIARKYVDKFYSDKGRSLAYARQLGAKKARAKLISYTDADTVVPDGCYARMIKELKSKGWVGVHAQIVSPENNNYWEWAEDQHFRAVFNNPGPRHRIGTIITVWDREKVLEFGFDPFMKRTSEDQDLCIRLGEAGFTVGVSTAVAYHRHRATFRRWVKQKFQYGKGNARSAFKHRNPKYLVTWLFGFPFFL